MKRKLVAILLTTTMVSGLVACGTGNAVSENAVSEDVVSEDSVSEDEVEEVQEEEEEAEEESLMGFNMVSNGTFDAGTDGWFSYMYNGIGALDWADGQMLCNISKIGTVEHGVQLYTDTFKLEEGCEYEIQFDVSSTVARKIQYRMQINGGDYHAYNMEILDVTPEMQHVDITFTMEEASDPAPRLVFNLGLVEDGATVEEEHTIAFDNIELYCIDESGRVGASGASMGPSIAINQLGYMPNDVKTAVFSCEDKCQSFTVVDATTGDVVYEGTVGTYAENTNTEREEAAADFSELKTAGTYKIVAADGEESFEFAIGEDVYADAFKDVVNMFNMQRCGQEIKGGDFAHKACHTAKAVYYENQSGAGVDVTGGWHDAGDYGRYVVAGAKAAQDLMLAYEDYPEAFADTINVLDEVKYELDWMMKMQDSDGGVHHKVTCAVFPGTVLPEEETDQLIITPVSTTATADFAAVMATAARVYQNKDKAYADKCLKAAESAYGYLATASIGSGVNNPDGVVTGAYDDTDDADERMWAAAELFRTTSNADYEKDFAKYVKESKANDLGWQGVGMYGVYAYLLSDSSDASAKKAAQDILTDYAKAIKGNVDKDTYGSSILASYVWGSNMSIANNGMILAMSQKLANTNYNNEMKAQLNYLLGENGTGYCFLTGYGSLSPEGTHHRPSQAVGKTMPGMLVGGPNSGLDDPYAQAVLADKAPALCYVDNEQSYSCNEITIYWNSPLVYLMAACMEK